SKLKLTNELHGTEKYWGPGTLPKKGMTPGQLTQPRHNFKKQQKTKEQKEQLKDQKMAEQQQQQPQPQQQQQQQKTRKRKRDEMAPDNLQDPSSAADDEEVDVTSVDDTANVRR